MKEKIQQIINNSNYNIGIYAESNGEILFAQNENNQYEAASCIKLYILIEFYKQVAEGKIKETDIIICNEEDDLEGVNPGIIRLLHNGVHLTAKDLATLMITYSDNLATNKLIELLGIDNINQTIKELGLNKTKLHLSLIHISEPTRH